MASFSRHSALQVAVLITFALAWPGAPRHRRASPRPTWSSCVRARARRPSSCYPVWRRRWAFESLQSQLVNGHARVRFNFSGRTREQPAAGPVNEADPSAGMAANQLRATLDAIARSKDPFVVAGLVVRRHGHPGVRPASPRRDRRTCLRGFVSEKHVHPGRLRRHDESRRAVRPIDMKRTREDLSQLDFGDLPTIVLTRGELEGFDDAS